MERQNVFHSKKMKITLDLLNKYDADDAFIKYLEDNGLLGADLMEIIDEKAPMELIYFFKKYLILTPDEARAIDTLFNIENSYNYWYSKDICNSYNIWASGDISNSSNIRYSYRVIDSNHIFRSKSIGGCKNVYKSNDVIDSTCVIESSDVRASEQVVRSNDVEWSENILLSFGIQDCGFVYQSSNLKDSYFCGFVNNSSHCLFCSGIKNKEYCVFDEEVDPQTFAMIMDELHERLNTEVTRMVEVNENKHTGSERLKFTPRFDSVFYGLSSDFYGWIGTLPNYTDDKFISLFFNERENLTKS